MAKGICPACSELVGISPTGKRQHPTRGTSTWWLVDMHKKPNAAELCDGSGEKI